MNIITLTIVLHIASLAGAVPTSPLDERVVENGLVIGPLGIRATSIPLRPALENIDDRELGKLLGAAVNGRSRVNGAMEFEERISFLRSAGAKWPTPGMSSVLYQVPGNSRQQWQRSDGPRWHCMQ